MGNPNREMATLQEVISCLPGFELSPHNPKQAKCICAHHRNSYKLNLNYENNKWRCAKCGEAGSPIALFMLFTGESDPHKAASTLYKKLRAGETVDIVPKNIEPENKNLMPLAPIEERNKTYKTLLNQLVLTKEHQDNLIKRGLSIEDIQKNEYRSITPNLDTKKLARQVLQSGALVEGVPGFYKNEQGAWDIRLYGDSGYLIPQRDGIGRIQGFQMRLDKGDRRYLPLTSSHDFKGTQWRPFIHYSKGSKHVGYAVITEGPLKADVITALSGYSVIAVPGVNSLGFLPRALHDLVLAGELKKVAVAYDADIVENEHVQKAQKKLIELLENMNIPYVVIKPWVLKYKGLDDYLLAIKEGKA